MLRAHGRSEQRRDERRRRDEWRDAWSCVRLWRCAVCTERGAPFTASFTVACVAACLFISRCEMGILISISMLSYRRCDRGHDTDSRESGEAGALGHTHTCDLGPYTIHR